MAGHSHHKLPLELIVIVADYLGPSDILHMIQGIPHVAPLLNSRHIQAQDKNGHTILHLIVEQGLEHLIQPLARWIPKNSIPNNAGWTPLHQAVRNGDERMTKALIHAGSHISAKDYSGRTALHLACDVDDLGILRFLLDHGANPSAADYNGHTLLHVTRIRGCGLFSKLRAAGGMVAPRRMPRGLTPLGYAAWLGREDAARILLEAWADPSIQTENGETILQRAVKGNHTSFVQLLLDVGVDVGVRDFSHGHTAMLTAAQFGADDCLRLLLKAGADVLAVDNLGRNALHLAARNGHPSTIRLLLKEGVDSTAQDNQGYDPLRYAIEGEQQGGVIPGDCKAVIRIIEDLRKNPFLRLERRMRAKCYSKRKS